MRHRPALVISSRLCPNQAPQCLCVQECFLMQVSGHETASLLPIRPIFGQVQVVMDGSSRFGEVSLMTERYIPLHTKHERYRVRERFVVPCAVWWCGCVACDVLVGVWLSLVLVSVCLLFGWGLVVWFLETGKDDCKTPRRPLDQACLQLESSDIIQAKRVPETRKTSQEISTFTCSQPDPTETTTISRATRSGSPRCKTARNETLWKVTS